MYGEDSDIYVFDLEHEQKRREQLEKLFNRTKEQIEEESYLIEELKKIEVRKKERERKQQDVNKLLTAVVDYENTANQAKISKQRGSIENRPSIGGSNSQANSSGTSNNNKRVKNRKYSTQSNSDIKASGSNLKQSNSGSTSNLATNKNNSGNTSLNNSTEAGNLSPEAKDSKNNKKSLIFKAVVESTGIKFPDTKVAGVMLRSTKMKLPQSIGTKKTKAIEQLLDELVIEHKPISTESVCEQFNELRSDIVLLYELQQALTNCDYEFQTLRHRYESIAPGKVNN